MSQDVTQVREGIDTVLQHIFHLLPSDVTQVREGIDTSANLHSVHLSSGKKCQEPGPNE